MKNRKTQNNFSSSKLCFFVFLIVNVILSYFSLPLETTLWVGFLGLALPLGLAFWEIQTDSFFSKPMSQSEFLPPIPIWAWIILCLLAVWIRFYKLTTLSVWPLYDEGMYGFYASHLSENWDWKFFFGPSQAPPFYLWGLGMFFRFFGVSLYTLWLFPAIISLLIVPAGYWAARQFFSKSFSFILGCLLGLSFWPVYVGRFGVMTGLVLLAECLVLALLGKFLGEPDEKKRKWNAIGLGIGTGLGFYTYLHWPLMAAMVYFTVFLSILPGFKKKPFLSCKLYGSFLVASFITASPLGFAFFREGGNQLGDYLHHLSATSSGSLAGQLAVSLSYISSLFWGMDLSFYTYQPVWGGYLNPILTSFFLIGLLELFFRRKTLLAQWLLWSLFLFILPGALTSERATSRLILVVPVLLAVSAWGVTQFFLASKPKNFRLFMILLTISFGLDIYHLHGAYAQVWNKLNHWKGYEKSYPRYQAYLQLETIAKEKGPGFIFGDFVPGLQDQTFMVATYGFNAAQNLKIQSEKASWAAVLTNIHYQPFLKNRFPDGKAYWVSKNMNSLDGGWMLWVFPLEPSRWKDVKRWQSASQALGPYIEKNLCYVPGRSFSDISFALQNAYPSFQGDPFLESCYWEKMADISLKQALSTDRHSGSITDTKGAIQCLSSAVKRGYPAAHLYRNLGTDELMAGNPLKAREYFRMAVQSPLNFTDAARYLEIVNSSFQKKLEKNIK
jgi:4-amino-4-deoxy-L-arabinose transferase-like glycosyltransferase